MLGARSTKHLVEVLTMFTDTGLTCVVFIVAFEPL